MPTNDIRARLPFLMHGISFATVFVWLSLVAAGLLGLVLVTRPNGHNILGVAITASFLTILLATDLSRFVPEFRVLEAVFLVLFTVVGVAVLLIRERRRIRRHRESVS